SQSGTLGFLMGYAFAKLLSRANPAPANRVLRAALTSRSCSAPHGQLHCLTDNPVSPDGPDWLPHSEQVLVENLESVSMNCVPLLGDLYASIPRICAWAELATLFPNRFAIPLMLSLLHTMSTFSETKRVVNL